MITNVQKVTSFFKVLSDPTRLKIVDILLGVKDTMCVSEIADAVGMSHSAVSHQLSKLELNEIVSCKRVGQTICYKIKNETVRHKLEKQIKAVV